MKRTLKENKNGMIRLYMDADEMLELLLDRLEEYWTKTKYSAAYNLFEKLYTERVANGNFFDSKFSVSEIVDNDYVNNYSIISPTDYDYEEYFEEYKNEDYDRIVEVCDEEYYEDDQPVFLISAR